MIFVIWKDWSEGITAMWMAWFGLDSWWVGDSWRVFKFKSGLIWKALKMRQRYVHLMCLEMGETVGKIEEWWKPCSRKATWTVVILWWAGQLRGCVVRGYGQVLLNQKSLPVPPAVPASLPGFLFLVLLSNHLLTGNWITVQCRLKNKIYWTITGLTAKAEGLWINQAWGKHELRQLGRPQEIELEISLFLCGEGQGTG